MSKQFQYYLALFLHLVVAVTSSIWAINELFLQTEILKIAFMQFIGNTLFLEIDKLSAFFILLINFTSLTAIIYAKAYLKPYFNKKSKTEFSLHFFNLLWLHISMILVVMLREALAFLIIWEIMSLSSFFLVIFESEKKETIKIGIKYLIQMHIGVVFLLVAFLLATIE